MFKILCLGLEHFFCKVFIIKQLYIILYYTREQNENSITSVQCWWFADATIILLSFAVSQRKDAVIVKNPREKVLFCVNVVKEI